MMCAMRCNFMAAMPQAHPEPESTSTMREHLLTPSLSGQRHSVNLYSPQSSFMVGFFAGPIALILYSALNSYRLKRLADVIAYLGAAIITVMLLYWYLITADGAVAVWLNEEFGRDATRFLTRFLALLLWGGFYLMHRKYHRSAEVFDVKPPRPWIPALLCAGLGYVILSAAVTAIKQGSGL
jgi:hypothetical protein